MVASPAMRRRARWAGMVLWPSLMALLLLPDLADGPAGTPTVTPGPSRARGPNVLILIGDDHAGGTLGIDGDPRQATPRLDALARQGVRFDRAYCNAPVCSASRQSFLTGRLPHAVGVTLLMTPLPEEAITLGEWLKAHGYRTAAFGKMHFNGPSAHGFDERSDLASWGKHLKLYPPAGGVRLGPWRPFVDTAATWLNADCRPVNLPAEAMDSSYFADGAIQFLRRPHDRPFLLVASFYDPHSPFHFPREWEGRYRPDQFPVPPASKSDLAERPEVFATLSQRDFRGIQAAYYTSLSFLDHQVGRVLDALDASGHADDTIVIYLGDNGYLLGQHGRFEKHCFYEQSVRVPLIVRWPGKLPEDRRTPEMVELVDVVPTLLDLLGLPRPPHLHGISLVPLLKGASPRDGGRGRDVVFSEYPENEEAMIRSSRYKLIVGTGQRRRKDGFRAVRPPTGPYQRLYDLEADPDETTDLSGKPELVGVKAGLRHRLYERLITTREGCEPVPRGLSEVDAIRWCLVPRDVGHAR
jgi:arylsulfatase A-like enzyme